MKLSGGDITKIIKYLVAMYSEDGKWIGNMSDLEEPLDFLPAIEEAFGFFNINLNGEIEETYPYCIVDEIKNRGDEVFEKNYKYSSNDGFEINKYNLVLEIIETRRVASTYHMTMYAPSEHWAEQRYYYETNQGHYHALDGTFISDDILDGWDEEVEVLDVEDKGPITENRLRKHTLEELVEIRKMIDKILKD